MSLKVNYVVVVAKLKNCRVPSSGYQYIWKHGGRCPVEWADFCIEIRNVAFYQIILAQLSNIFLKSFVVYLLRFDRLP